MVIRGRTDLRCTDAELPSFKTLYAPRTQTTSEKRWRLEISSTADASAA